jgi:hypothetical protein
LLEGVFLVKLSEEAAVMGVRIFQSGLSFSKSIPFNT